MIGIFVSFILSQSMMASAELQKVTHIYPEDYSFRSGLVFKEEQLMDTGKIITYKYWNSRYPFVDPNDQWVEPLDRIDKFIGFKAKLLKKHEGTLPYDYAKVSYNIVMVPYLEAAETVTIYYTDSGEAVVVSAQRTEFDEYGNPKKTYNLGYTGEQKKIHLLDNSRGAIRGRTYHTELIRNPKIPLLDGNTALLEVNTQHTSLYSLDPLYHVETEEAKRDTRVTEIDYLYENEDMDYCMVDQRPEYYGYYNVEQETIHDAYGNELSKTTYTYPMNPEDFAPCYTNSGHADNFNCPFWEVSDGGPGDVCSARLCARTVPNTIISTPLRFGLDTEQVIEYDECGNTVGVEVSRVYKHPTKTGENSFYKKRVELGYDSLKVAPVEVSVFNPDSPDKQISKQATYSDAYNLETATNERGRTSEYEYDSLGRMKKVWVYPEQKGVDEPTMKYEYEKGYFGMKVKESVKIEPGRYTERYHFYDGMGRHIQTQIYNDQATALDDDTFTANLKVYDVLGRVIREYRTIEKEESSPLFSFGSLIGEDEFIVLGKSLIEYEYDDLGRVLTLTDWADGSVITKKYDIQDSYTNSALTYTTDPELKTRTFTSDAMGNLVKVSLHSLT